MPRIEERDAPDFTDSLHDRQAPALRLVRDVWDGTDALRAAGTTYLPRFQSEEASDYERRLSQAVLFNALNRTVRGLVGMLFRKPPQLSADTPEFISEHAQNIDLAGRDLATFARDAAESAWIDGHTLIHVEYPRVDASAVRSVVDERQMGVRPYWVHVLKQDVMSVRWELDAGRPRIMQFVYAERRHEPEGTFGEREVVRYRVLRPDEFEVWQQDGEEWMLVDSGPQSLGEVPIVPIYANRTGFMESEPPLHDLAHENIEHYQVRSEYRDAMRKANMPIPIFKGRLGRDGDVKAGPSYGIDLDKEGDAYYMEPKGSALAAARQELQDSEARMAALGLSMLVRETRAAETAEAKRLDRAESDSALAASAHALQAGLTEALRVHARWMGRSMEGEVEVNTDFLDQEIDPNTLKVLQAMVGSGDLSLETMWEIMRRGELLPETFDPDLEMERIRGMGPALLPAAFQLGENAPSSAAAG